MEVVLSQNSARVVDKLNKIVLYHNQDYTSTKLFNNLILKQKKKYTLTKYITVWGGLLNRLFKMCTYEFIVVEKNDITKLEGKVYINFFPSIFTPITSLLYFVVAPRPIILILVASIFYIRYIFLILKISNDFKTQVHEFFEEQL